SATNRDLEGLIGEGKFREDLYYRLNVFPIHLPPLRERPEDIPRLVEHFVAKFARTTGKNVRGFSPEAGATLSNYHGPGNVGELENAGERAVIICRGAEVTPHDLDFGRRAATAPGIGGPAPAATLQQASARPLSARLLEEEKREIMAAIDKNGGNIAGAARALGINRSTLYYRLRKHGLEHLLPTKVVGPGEEAGSA